MQQILLETFISAQIIHHSTQNPFLLRLLRPRNNQRKDSSHSDTYGKQEYASYNAHYGTAGFHPMVAFDGLTGDFLKAQLRPGNVYTSNGVVAFLRPLLEHYSETFPKTSVLVRETTFFVKIKGAV